jgi:hypothetical protein
MNDDSCKDDINCRKFLGLVLVGVLGTIASGIALNAKQKADTRPRRLQIIDTHFHTFNTKLQGSKGIPSDSYMHATIEYEPNLMDRGGVDKACLITYTQNISTEHGRTWSTSSSLQGITRVETWENGPVPGKCSLL